jgi:hypothetical protein
LLNHKRNSGCGAIISNKHACVAKDVEEGVGGDAFLTDKWVLVNKAGKIVAKALVEQLLESSIDMLQRRLKPRLSISC